MNTSTPSAVEVLKEIAAERERQIHEEGWTPAHDDTHTKGELSDAAACYALGMTAGFWPFDAEWWKPSDPRRNLIRAAALLVAEIERIDRAKAIALAGGE